MCGGTGRTEPTALDRLDLAETGVMDLQCLTCDGTGQTMLTPPPGLWCNRCRPFAGSALQYCFFGKFLSAAGRRYAGAEGYGFRSRYQGTH